MSNRKSVGNKRTKPSTGNQKPKLSFNLNNKFVDEEILSSSDDDNSEKSATESEDESDVETADQKRRRLAKEYLNSVQNEEDSEDEASDDDFHSNDVIAAKLRQHRLESQGKYFRCICFFVVYFHSCYYMPMVVIIGIVHQKRRL
jgi:ribosomal RNA-processing protein 9